MTEPDYLSIIRERGSGALDKKMGIEITEASLTRLVGTMPVEGNTQPMGILHGGANVVLAESLGSIGTQLNAGANRRIVGIDINATHHKATATGVVTGVATAVSIGKTLCCWDIVITNENLCTFLFSPLCDCGNNVICLIALNFKLSNTKCTH